MNIKYVGTGLIGVVGVVLLALALGGKDETQSVQLNPEKLVPVSSVTHGHGLAVDPTDSGKLYIATHEGLLTLIKEKDLYQVGVTKDDYMGFVAHPNDPKTFYSSGHPAAGGNIGFQKSTDGAYNWQKVSEGNEGPVDFHAMTVSPVDTNIVYGWYRGNLQKSTNEGKSWTSIKTNAPIVALAADTKDVEVVYAASPTGMLKSSDSGKTFVKLLDGFTAAIAVDPLDNQHIMAFTESKGLAVSNDGGKSWQGTGQQFGEEMPLFISFYKKDSQLGYLLTEQNSLYKTQDGGKSWQKIALASTPNASH